MNESFGPEKRLKKRKDFERIFIQGKVVKNEWFVAKYLENNLKTSRIGIVVSRKFGKAHVRNRFKRYVRETFRKMNHDKGVDVLIFPKKELKSEFERMDYKTFSRMLKALLEKIVSQDEEVRL